MNKLINYFRFCIFFNFLTTILIFILIGMNKVKNDGNDILIYIAINNSIKIYIQSLIINTIKLRLSYTKFINSDRFLDIVKLFIYTYIFTIYQEFSINIFITFLFVFFIINTIVIIAQFLFDLLNNECCSANNYNNHNNYIIINQSLELPVYTKN